MNKLFILSLLAALLLTFPACASPSDEDSGSNLKLRHWPDSYASAPAAGFTLAVSDVSQRVADLREFVAARGGLIDRVYLASAGDDEEAEVVFRVFAKDFNPAVRFIEGQGRVESRELLERHNPLNDGIGGIAGGPSSRPDSRFQVAYLDGSSSVNLWLPLFTVIALLLLAAVIAYLLRIAYRRGRQRGSFM